MKTEKYWEKSVIRKGPEIELLSELWGLVTELRGLGLTHLQDQLFLIRRIHTLQKW